MAEIFEKGFNTYLRKASRQTPRQPKTPPAVICPLCDQEIPDATEVVFGQHVRAKHAEVLPEFTPNEKDESGLADQKIRELWAKAEKSARDRWAPTPSYTSS